MAMFTYIVVFLQYVFYAHQGCISLLNITVINII